MRKLEHIFVKKDHLMLLIHNKLTKKEQRWPKYTSSVYSKRSQFQAPLVVEKVLPCTSHATGSKQQFTLCLGWALLIAGLLERATKGEFPSEMICSGYLSLFH